MIVMLYLVGAMAEVGIWAASAGLLFRFTEMDVLELMCISAMITFVLGLPILMQIERWISGIE